MGNQINIITGIAEEMIQEIFTKIWEKRKDLREELSFKSYLFTIAFNMVRKYFRTQAVISEYLHCKPSASCILLS